MCPRVCVLCLESGATGQVRSWKKEQEEKGVISKLQFPESTGIKRKHQVKYQSYQASCDVSAALRLLFGELNFTKSLGKLKRAVAMATSIPGQSRRLCGLV